MKKLSVLLCAAAALLASCAAKPNDTPSGAGGGVPAVASFEVERADLECTIRADIPEPGLRLAVGEWLDEQLGGCYPGDAADLEALVAFYGQAKCDSLQQVLDEDGVPAVDFEAIMEKAYETPQFVTYTLSTLTGLGGAHPLSAELGATFRKRDGRRLTWDIVRQPMRYVFNDILLQALVGYFGVQDAEQLGDVLMDVNVYGLPLPKTPPILLENGVVAIYQQYEIAAYAYGMPNDTIPYERMKPVMTEWARRLLEK